MGGLVFLALAALVIVGGFLGRKRIRDVVGGGEPIVTDEVLRAILEEGELEAPDEEPLDEDAIRDAEDEFWGEEWDDPEPWAG